MHDSGHSLRAISAVLLEQEISLSPETIRRHLQHINKPEVAAAADTSTTALLAVKALGVLHDWPQVAGALADSWAEAGAPGAALILTGGVVPEKWMDAYKTMAGSEEGDLFEADVLSRACHNVFVRSHPEAARALAEECSLAGADALSSAFDELADRVEQRNATTDGSGVAIASQQAAPDLQVLKENA
jgi:hypothetical protein